MNRSEVLRAVEWVDQAARDGNLNIMAKAKKALEEELSSPRNTTTSERAYENAIESFVRKHGREPMEDVVGEDE
jgi:hypothetical protein